MAADIFNPSYPTYFGLEVNPENTASDNIASSTNWWAGMIRPTVSKNATSLQFLHWGHGGSFVLMTVGLYTDSGGAPGTLLQVGTVTPGSDFTWDSVSISSQAVVAGTAYWVVVHGSTLGVGNSLDLRRIDDPDQLVAGLANRFSAAVSSNSGVSWSNQGGTYMGCVGLGYSDATFEGCGYGDFDNFSINNASDQWGEYFQVPSNITINGLSCKINSPSGTPSADLTFVLMNADTVTTLASGIIVPAASVTASFVWYTANFGSINLVTGTNYRFYLTSTAGSSPQYMIHVPKTVNNGNSNAMTFGGTTDVLAQNNSGSFGTDQTRDVPFRLVLATSTGAVGYITLLGTGQI